ncbi:hypothetical protein RRG08_025925 [Elysia crispata]|uniref:Uncharacterized protein n=1 Tax=Elysia crispata TaxID=231223 RepID=A0AAE1DP63_9GAST|nr:hypothetical protein RRG08_025925 [Elysia crispata]
MCACRGGQGVIQGRYVSKPGYSVIIILKYTDRSRFGNSRVLITANRDVLRSPAQRCVPRSGPYPPLRITVLIYLYRPASPPPAFETKTFFYPAGRQRVSPVQFSSQPTQPVIQLDLGEFKGKFSLTSCFPLHGVEKE